MSKLRRGDFVRFISDFQKVGDDANEDITVSENETGTIIDVHPEMLIVEAPCQRGLDRHMGPIEVDPAAVELLLHGEDSRLPMYATGQLAWPVFAGAARHAFRVTAAEPLDQDLLVAGLVRLARSDANRRRASQDTYRSVARFVAGLPRDVWVRFAQTLTELSDEDLAKLVEEESARDVPPEAHEERIREEQKQRPYRVDPALVTSAMAIMRDEFTELYEHKPDLRDYKDALRALKLYRADIEEDFDLVRPQIKDWNELDVEYSAVARVRDRLDRAIKEMAEIDEDDWREALDWYEDLHDYEPPVLPELPRVEVEEAIIEDAPVEDIVIPLKERRGPSIVVAKPGVSVFNNTKKEKGTIVSTVGDKDLVVETPTGQETWDARDVIVDLAYHGPFERLPHSEYTSWQQRVATMLEASGAE